MTVPPPEPVGGVTPVAVPGVLDPAGGVTPELFGILEVGGVFEPGGVTLLASPGNPVIGFEFGAVMLLALLTLERAIGVTELGG